MCDHDHLSLKSPIQLLGRSLRVDHVEKYRLPKKLLEKEEEEKEHGAPYFGAGHAYKDAELMPNKFDIHQGQDLFAPVEKSAERNASSSTTSEERRRKRKEKHKRRKESRRKHTSRKENKRNQQGVDTASEDSYRPKKRSKSERKRSRRIRDD